MAAKTKVLRRDKDRKAGSQEEMKKALSGDAETLKLELRGALEVESGRRQLTYLAKTKPPQG